MNAISLPQPLTIDKDTVTVSRAAWEALVEQLEDAADLATVAANDARRAAIGEDAFRRECVTADELLQMLDGTSPITIHRRRANMTQRALAQAADLSESYLNEMEKGKKPGSAKALRKLAAVLNVPIEALMD